MDILFDRDFDVMYIKLSDNLPYSHGVELDENRYIDYGENEEVIGIEIHSLKSGVNIDGLPKQYEVKHALKMIGAKICEA